MASLTYCKKVVIHCILFVFLPILNPGCIKTQPKSSSSQELSVQLVNEPLSLDPAFAEDGVSLQVLANVFEGLVGYDGQGNLQNQLAESYSISSDGKIYEFSLRKNAKWSDGRPVQVQDFVLAFQRLLRPESTSKLISFFLSIRGAEQFHLGKLPKEKLRVYEKNSKLIIELNRRIPYFIQALSLPVAFPIRQDILQANGGKWPDTGPSTGSYRIRSHVIGQKIELEKNLNYWGKAPEIENVTFLVVIDESTGLHLFEQGRLDLLLRIPAFDFSRLQTKGVVHTFPFFSTYYIAFNINKPPFDQRNWRRAISGVIQRKGITEILGSGEVPAWGWIPKGLEGYIAYRDPKEAYKDSIIWFLKKYPQSHSPEITIAFDSGARNSKIFEKIQNDLKDGLGVQVSLNQMEWRSFLKAIHSDTPSVFRLGWMAPFKDPISHLKVFTSKSPNNYFHFSRSDYDQLVLEIEGLSPGPDRESKIFRAQEILLDEAVVVPIYHYVQNIGVSNRVKHFQANSFGIIKFQELSFKE